MNRHLVLYRLATAGAFALTLALAGCGGDDGDITVYSGRQEDLVEDLFEQFEEATGIKLDDLNWPFQPEALHGLFDELSKP